MGNNISKIFSNQHNVYVLISSFNTIQRISNNEILAKNGSKVLKVKVDEISDEYNCILLPSNVVIISNDILLKGVNVISEIIEDELHVIHNINECEKYDYVLDVQDIKKYDHYIAI